MHAKDLSRRQILGGVVAAGAATGAAAPAAGAAESMVDYTPMPPHIAAARGRHRRTPIYAQEIVHRRATCKRGIPGI